MASPLLQVARLIVSYSPSGRQRAVVHGVDFAVHAGEILALVGASGSGKTTIARAVLGLLPPPPRAIVQGSVRLEGQELLADPSRRRKALGVRLAHVPQDPLASLNPVQRIGRQVEEVLRIHRLTPVPSRAAAAGVALERAGLDPASEYRSRYPHQLSGGQRQRAIIAGALVASPHLLIADEPTSALDVTVQRRVLDLLTSVARDEGAGLLLITHDLAVAAERADRILVLHDGHIVEQGAAATVSSDPQSDTARALFSASPSLRTPLPPRREAAGEVLVQVRGATKRFATAGRSLTAVDDVSFELREGESLGIVGESGSGKSTLARLLLGLSGTDAGDIRVGDQILRGRVPARKLRQVARLAQPVFQDPSSSFDPQSRIGQAIAEPLRGFGIGRPAARRERVREVARLVHLPSELLDRKPHELSGGQLQRAAIARALAAQPKLLVCDEAVSSLDVLVQSRVLALLRRLQDEQGVAILLISHDLAVVRGSCDRVAVMQRGVIVETGATGRVFETPQHPYTRELIAAIPNPVGHEERGEPGLGSRPSGPPPLSQAPEHRSASLGPSRGAVPSRGSGA